MLTTRKIKKFEFGLLYVGSTKTITICTFYINFFVIGITVMLLFVITVWCSIVL